MKHGNCGSLAVRQPRPLYFRGAPQAFFLVFILGILFAMPLAAQSATPPSPPSTAAAPHVSALPQDASGTYAFDHRNKSIEIDMHHGKLKGYISRLGDAETDKGTPLTYFFDHTSIQDDHLTFTTKIVHGLWYSFDGTIVRGDAAERDDEGYYVLTGQLLVHHPREGGKSSEEIVEQRSVHYKSLAQ